MFWANGLADQPRHFAGNITEGEFNEKVGNGNNVGGLHLLVIWMCCSNSEMHQHCLL
jgi:hypothetical protein